MTKHNIDIGYSEFDYYPFGMLMPGRSALPHDYRFGFNGQEMSNELKGEGNSNTAEYWEYDTRLGRRWNIDPITFAWQSPYVCFNNNPIYYSDPSGATGEETIKKGDSFVGEDGKTYTSSFNEAEVVAEKQVSSATNAHGVENPINNSEPKFPSNIPTEIVGLSSVIESLADNLDSKYVKDASQGFGYVMAINDLRTAAQAEPNKYNNGLSPVTIGTDAIVPGLGSLTESMINRRMEDFESDDFQILGKTNYAKFRDYVNQQNSVRGPDKNNTIILVYTNYKIYDNFIPNSKPTWIAEFNRAAASSQYNINAKYVYWGYLKDYKEKKGSFVIRGNFTLE